MADKGNHSHLVTQELAAPEHNHVRNCQKAQRCQRRNQTQTHQLPEKREKDAEQCEWGRQSAECEQELAKPGMGIRAVNEPRYEQQRKEEYNVTPPALKTDDLDCREEQSCCEQRQPD